MGICFGGTIKWILLYSRVMEFAAMNMAPLAREPCYMANFCDCEYEFYRKRHKVFPYDVSSADFCCV